MYVYWQKQSKEAPLFSDLIWSRPENKKLLGSLLIIGGNIHGISSVNLAYSEALKQRVGSLNLFLPDKTTKLLPVKIPEISYLPSTDSGSFSLEGLGKMKQISENSDGTLFSGDFGHNSETSILLEKMATLKNKHIYAQDCLDAFINQPGILLDRLESLLVIDFARLQKFLSRYGYDKPLTSRIDLVHFVEFLHDLTCNLEAIILTRLGLVYLLAYKGEVISTKLNEEHAWPVLACASAIWWIQHPNKPFESIATSLVC